MKKRLIAALVLLTLVIGLCSLGVTATNTTDKYLVGYAKVDLDPLYTAEFREFAGEMFPTVAFTEELTFTVNIGAEGDKTVTLRDGDHIPVALQGNSHTEVRLNIGNQDDNGDGIVDENDGIFATAIAITAPGAKVSETVILMATDTIGANENVTDAVRKNLFEKYGITGDRVMIDGSHTHHGPHYGATVEESAYPEVYYLQRAWYYYLRVQLTQAAEEAIADRSAATMSRGTIEAEEAEVAKGEVGDYLNEIRKANKAADATKYAGVKYVTQLAKSAPSGQSTSNIDGYGHEKWTKDGIAHVIVPELFEGGVYYNGVRHDQSTRVEALRTNAWLSSGSFYAYDYPKTNSDKTNNIYTGLPAEYYYVPCNWDIENQRWMSAEEVVARGYAEPEVFATGNNFNSNFAVDKPGEYTLPTKYIRLDPNATQEELLTRDYINAHLVDASEVLFEPKDAARYPKRPYIIDENGEKEYIYVFIDATVAIGDQVMSEVDDTLLLLKFTFDDVTKEPVLLVNWRAHTNKNRKSSVDWKKEYTVRGYFDSFYQISSDWINALRYGLEFAGFRVAYFAGASGNVNGYYPFQNWYIPEYEKSGSIDNIIYTEKKGTILTEEDKEKYITLKDGTTYKITADDVGKCKESLQGYDVIEEGYIVGDASHLKNSGAIYGTELAQVALELLSGKNENFQMTEIISPTGGIRSLQTVYQTNPRVVSLAEFLAAGQHRALDYSSDRYGNNLSSSYSFSVFYWELEKGNTDTAIIDETYVCSMLDINGYPAQKVDSHGQPVPKYDADGNPVYKLDEKGEQILDENKNPIIEYEFYTQKEIETAYPRVRFDENGKVANCVRTKTRFAIAAYLHANSAISKYPKRHTATGTQMELNAIMLCKEIALIIGPGEFYDRYSTTARWTAKGYEDVQVNDPEGNNLWKSLHSKTYGEPFFLGYANASPGYLPSQVTYMYNDTSDDMAKGAYETQTTSYAKGTGEAVINEFAWLLEQTNGGSESVTTETGYCEHCGKNVQWMPLSIWNAHSVFLQTGHYYLDKDIKLAAALNISETINACLDLAGHTLTGYDRAFLVEGTLNLQDSEGNGTVIGSGFNEPAPKKDGGYYDYGPSGGVGYISDGGVLNLYGGTLKTVTTKTYKPGNGGILLVATNGTFNMHGGLLAYTQTGWAGAAVYSDVGSFVNLYSGTVQRGKAVVSETECLLAKGNIMLSGDANVDNLLLWPADTEEFKRMFTIKGKYTGTAAVTYRNHTLTLGEDIGNVENVDLSQANLTIMGTDLQVAVDGTDLKMAPGRESKCEHCDETVSWSKLSRYKQDSTLAAGHYYVDVYSLEMADKTVGAQVCLDLNGKTLKGAERAFFVTSGGVLSIQDSSEEKSGVLMGQGFEEYTNSNPNRGGNGGTVNVDGGTLNLYSGKLTLEKKAEWYVPGNGAVVCTNSTFNMYGGEIVGSESGWIGGAVCVQSNKNAVLNMSGGKISGGTAAAIASTGCVVIRNKIVLSGDAEIDGRLCLYKGETPLAAILEVQGKFKGRAEKIVFHNANVPVVEGLDIGTATDDAKIPLGTLLLEGGELAVGVDGTNLVLKDTKLAEVVNQNGSGETVYTSMEEALRNYTSPSVDKETGLFMIPQTVKLLADLDELTINKTVVLDLNGHHVGKLIASGKETIVYCMDSANFDTQQKEVNGKTEWVTDYYANRCGTVSQKEGEGKVIAAPAGAYNINGQKASTYLYLELRRQEDDKAFTYHAISLDVKKAFVRPSQGGMYFGAEFGGDDAVIRAVDFYGIAMSVQEIPTAETMGTTALYTRIANNEGDYQFGSEGLVTAVENALINILREGNSDSSNRMRAATEVYVRAYIKIGDQYFFGNRKITSLEDLTERISQEYINEEGEHTLSDDQWDALVDMYNKFTGVMKRWSIKNLKTAISKGQ